MNFVFASPAKQSSFKRRDCFTAFETTNVRLFFDGVGAAKTPLKAAIAPVDRRLRVECGPVVNAIKFKVPAPFRHCELREAIQTRVEPAARLLRFARNDKLSFTVTASAQPF